MAEYKQKKIVDKEVQTNGFEKRSEEFQDDVTERGEIYEMIQELTEEATDKAFKDKGIEKIEKYAGVYATGKSYGAGVQKGKYEVRLSSNVKTVIQKQTIFGTKRMETEITSDLDAENDLLTVHYDGTEKAVFRGHTNNDDPMGYMINDKITISTKDDKKLKKELKDFFDNCAKKEVEYLTKTKLGIDDRMETSIAGSIVENAKKHTMEINDLLNSSPEEIADFFGGNNLQESEAVKNIDPEGEEVNGPEDFHHQDVIDANTNGNLLFDDEVSEEEAGGYQALLDAMMEDMFPGKEFKELSNDEKSQLFIAVEKVWVSEEEKEAMMAELTINENQSKHIQYANYLKINQARIEASRVADQLSENTEELEEITSTATAGGFGYQTPYAFKDTNYAKKKKKKPSIKKSKNEGDSFWTTVELDDIKDTHPLGMPGVKVGSKDELEKSKKGGAKATKFIQKLQEGRTHDVNKRKFFDETQNLEEGKNKRYLVTNKLSQDELKNKWSKLSTFVSESTINKDALTDEDKALLEGCGCGEVDDKDYTYLNGDVVSREEAEKIMHAQYEEENEEIEAMANMENLVDIQKPGSFVILKISESDLVNENKKFVLDHVTGHYVLHPGMDQANIVSENKSKVFDIATRTYIDNPKYRK